MILSTASSSAIPAVAATPIRYTVRRVVVDVEPAPSFDDRPNCCATAEGAGRAGGILRRLLRRAALTLPPLPTPDEAPSS